MRRLVFAHGPWQLIMAASALKQASSTTKRSADDVLVILDRGLWSSAPSSSIEPGSYVSLVRDSWDPWLADTTVPSPIGEVMHRLAPALWPWSRIIVLDIGDEDHWAERLDSRRPAAILRAQLGEIAPDELWFDCLGGAVLDVHRMVYRVVAEVFPDTRIVLFEDGVDTYVNIDDLNVSMNRWLSEPRMAYRAVKARLRQWREPGNLVSAPLIRRQLARVAASYLWMSTMLPVPPYQQRLPWVQLETRFIKDTVERAAARAPDIELDKPGGDDKRVAILLGQCFSSWGHLDRTVELECYIAMARRLKQLGYAVVWKEHPRRARDPLLPDLARAEGVRAVPELGPWPVELFVKRWGVAACAAVTSTSIFSLPLLFGVRSFSVAARYASLLTYPCDLMAQLVAQSIAHLDEADALVTNCPGVERESPRPEKLAESPNGSRNSPR